MASGLRNGYVIKVTGHVILGGKDYDISKVDIEFSLGDVGRAEVYIPVGRVAKSSSNMNSISTSNGMLDTIGPMTPAEVRLKFEPKGQGAPKGRNLGFPANKDFAVFKGFVQSPGQTRIYGGTANMVVKLFGFLGSLAGASSFNSGFRLLPSANSAVPVLVGYSSSSMADNIADWYTINFGEKITENMWTLGLYEMLKYAIGQKNMWNQLTAGAGATRAALDRVNAGVYGGFPLRLLMFNTSAKSLVSKQITRFFSYAIHMLWKYGKESGGNFFTVIKQLENAFLWTMVPGINNDGLLPLTQMLSQSYITVHPDEYFGESLETSWNEDDYSYLTEVGVLPGNASTTPWQESPTKAKFVGYATLNDIGVSEKDLLKWPARVMIARAQPWMLPPSPSAKDGNNAGEELNDMWSPKLAGREKPEDQQWSKQELAYTEARLGSNYAKACLVNELFYNRKMRFMGKARFDICPGSTIGVEVVEDPFSNVKPQVLYGFVEYVKINVGLGNGNPNASTVFGLSSVRTKPEHEQYTVNSHPMYLASGNPAVGFKGAPLTEEAK
jgi:hypothetical protein